MPSIFLPTTLKEAQARGWEQLDVILVTGDAYVDHPSFGVAVVGRFLESLGARVGILAMPNVDKQEDFTRLGAPAWFFGVTAGNLDSMLMRTTSSKKPRSDDDYAPGGKAGLRPKRATIAYCNKLREIFHESQILIGGLEASLRRHGHYDYWDNKVRRSILLDSRADLLVFGMAERPLASIVEAVREGKRLRELKDIHGTATMINLSERKELGDDAITLPSYEEVSRNKVKYARASRIIHLNQNPWSGKILVQKHENRYVRVNAPALPFSTKELDAVYALPFTRESHPSYKERIPAFEMIRFSVTSMRGCFGGCSFCALTVHQGKAIQSRSVKSIEEEVRSIANMKGFTGYVSDVGGPTANMYKMGCRDPKAESACRKISCVFPDICPRLDTDHSPQIEMLRKARAVKGVKKVFVGSGVRYDLANLSPEYIRELVRHHVSGQLKVAPEHCHPDVLAAMRKPPIEEFEKFGKRFTEESKNARLDQYLVPYFISSHPGCGLEEQVALAKYLRDHNLRPLQAQEFIPLPLTLAGDMYYTGIDPMTGSELTVAKGERDRKLQRALMQYFKPENQELVRQALRMTRKSEPGESIRMEPGPHRRPGATQPGKFRGKKKRSK
jgi:uncharacterized radical SAM protein YgiQ